MKHWSLFAGNWQGVDKEATPGKVEEDDTW
jgi:hypothetical protein